jgi:hypothetical protein
MFEPHDPKPSQSIAELHNRLAILTANAERLSQTAVEILIQARRLASADMDQEPDWQWRQAA